MRITHNMMTRNYTNNLNKNLKNLNRSNEKLSSQRAFNKGWEDVSGANRALRLRTLLSDNERQLSNIEDIRGRYNSAEDNLRAINDITNKVSDKLLAASNGTLPAEDRLQISKEINNLQEQVFQIMNVEYAGKHVFSASGNATGGAPFSLVDGALSFNGTPVDSMVVGADGNPYMPDGTTPVPFNKHSYVDIGMGFDMDAAGELDPRTALRATFSGIETFGFGTTADGMPNNLYSLLGKISEDIFSGDVDKMGQNLTQLKACQTKLLTQVTDVGTLSAYIDQTAERLKNDTLNFQTVQNGIEAVPLDEEIMYNKDFEMAWMVTLQLGSKILPPTIFDFIR